MGCFRCRKATDIENDEMLIVIPFSRLEETINSLERLYKGSLPKARKK